MFSYAAAAVLVYTGADDGFSWAKVIAGGASLVRFTSILISALVGGHIYGREREDGTADYLLRLPASRSEKFCSKLLVSSIALALIWLISLTLLFLGLASMGYGLDTNFRVMQVMVGFIACGVAVFGASWLASCYMESAVGASFVGLLILVPIVAAQLIANRWYAVEDRSFFHWSTVLCQVVIGCTCLYAAFQKYTRPNGRCMTSAVFRTGLQSLKSESADDGSFAWHGTPRPNALRALVSKDTSLVRPSLVLGLMAVSLPYLIGFVGMSIHINGAPYFRGASVICAALACLVTSFWAAQITSSEHSATTNEFSSYLPIPRAAKYVSMLLVTLCPAIGMTYGNIAFLIVSNNLTDGSSHFGPQFTWNDWNGNGFIVMGLVMSNGTILAYSISFLVGTVYRRPAPAILSGVIAAILCVLAWAVTSSGASLAADTISPFYFVLIFSSLNAIVAAGAIAMSWRGKCRRDGY